VDHLGATIVSQSPSGSYRIDLHGLSINITSSVQNQTRKQTYGTGQTASDTDEPNPLVEKRKAQDIRTLEQATVSGGWRVCLFEGPDGVQLKFIEMKKS
jgi:hypothetical protein